MREILILAWLAIIVVGGASTFREILTVPADQLCIGCG